MLGFPQLPKGLLVPERSLLNPGQRSIVPSEKGGGPSGPATLLNLDFTTPTTQAFPATATAFNTLTGATPDHIYTMQEASGDLLDKAGSLDIPPFSSGHLYQQTAVGLWDGSSYTGRYAIGAGSAAKAWQAASSYTLADGISAAVVIVLRTVSTLNVNPVQIPSSAGLAITSFTNGQVRFYTGSNLFDVTNAFPYDGSWTCIVAGWHAGAEETRVITSTKALTSEANSAGHGGLSGVNLSLAMQSGQIAYFAILSDTDAETMLTQSAFDSFWTAHQDPTGMIDTHTRASLISDVVATDGTDGDYVAHFSGGSGYAQFPVSYRGALAAGAGGLGLLTWPVITNLLEDSEDFTQWTAGANVTTAALAGTSPTGLKDASSITNTGTNGTCRTPVIGVSTNTDYTFCVWVSTTQGQQIGVGVNNNADTAQLAQIYPTPTAGKWTRYSVNFNTGSDTTVRPWIIPEVGSSGDDLLAYGAMVVVGEYSASNTTTIPYVRTTGASASSAATVYKITGQTISNAQGDITATFLYDGASAPAADRVVLSGDGATASDDLTMTGVRSASGWRRVIQYLTFPGVSYSIGPIGSAIDGTEDVFRYRWRVNSDLPDVPSKGADLLLDGSSIGTANTSVGAPTTTYPTIVIGDGVGATGDRSMEGVISTIVWKDDAEDA